MGLLGQGFIYIITWNMNGKASEKVTYKYIEGWSLINLTFNQGFHCTCTLKL